MMRHWWIVFFLLQVVSSFGQKDAVLRGKISSQLQQKLSLIGDHDTLQLSISVKHDAEFLVKHFRLKAGYKPGNIFYARLNKKDILSLANQSNILFINEQHAPKEELNTGAVDYTLNRINKAHRDFPTIKGDSVFIVLKERAFDTADIDVKGRTFSSGLQAPTQTAHASMMTTIIAGAGNSSPFALGVAPSSFVGSVDFANLFPGPTAFYQQNKVSVENHSYGTVVENFYGNEAVAYDVSAVNHPALVQVFSAGNSGASMPTAGNYTGIAAMANLTGNFKQSKNTISVTALDSLGNAMAAASRGPAFDGRIKPELAAYGEDGSSGAAALVSGTAALIQNAYKKVHGQLPTSDLVKAVLINSADDVGPSGIDYLTGYGSLNAHKAIEAVLQSRYFQGSLTQDEVRSFSLTIPANISKLKLTLTWTDPAAQPNASKALVNDLDVIMREDLSGQVWEPWVLNAKPSKDSLLEPAQRRKDSLNNVEHLTIDAPALGTYRIEVKGTKVISPQQSFALSFQLDTAAGFSWSFPTGSDPLLAGGTQVVRWNTTISGNGNLEYSVDGTNWKPVSNSINLAANQFKWIVPDTLSTALLRMVVGGRQFRSDTFTISPLLNLQVGFNCADSFLLYWPKLPFAQYQLKQLGNQYLELFQTTSDTVLLLSKQQNPSRYYSVTPLINDKAGFRSTTLAYDAAGVDCYFVSFYLQSQTTSSAFFRAELGTLFNVKELSLQKLTPGGYVTLQTVRSMTAALFTFSDSSLLNGENHYRLKLMLQNGTVLYSDAEKVYHFAQSPVFAYPNPVKQNEQLKIISKEAGRYTVRILNSNGAEVFQQSVTNSFITLSASRFSKGLYFVWVVDREGKSFVQKLIIQ